MRSLFRTDCYYVNLGPLIDNLNMHAGNTAVIHSLRMAIQILGHGNLRLAQYLRHQSINRVEVRVEEINLEAELVALNISTALHCGQRVNRERSSTMSAHLQNIERRKITPCSLA